MEIVNNKKLFRFETLLADGSHAILTYRWQKGSMLLMHTFVPDAGRGMGIASALSKYALENARSQGFKVVVYCPFVAKYLKDHPEYNDVVEAVH